MALISLAQAWPTLPFAILCFVLLVQIRSRLKSRLPLPPGPSGLPFVGNVQEFPLTPERISALHAQYGDLVRLTIFGDEFILLGSHESAVALLEKRSSNYSGRNMFELADMTNFDWLLTWMPYGTHFRKVRGCFHRCFNATAIQAYRPIQQEEVKRHLLRLLEHPRDFYEHGRKLIGTVIIRIVYGLDVKDSLPGCPPNKYISIAEESMSAFSVIFHPGQYYAQSFPWLRYVPAWFPGARFQRDFAAWRPIVRSMLNVPWKAAGKLTVRSEGKMPPWTFYANTMERIENNEEDEYAAKCTAASAYFGGADTTLSTLQIFTAAMASSPHVQKRAQEELDAVVGPGRLPTLEDKPSLPYVSAVAKECLRWRQVVPINVPHICSEEDEFNGYRIPKEARVISNAAGYSMDPKNYQDPETFNPDRFLVDGKLSSEILDPASFAFGYGRRICPGRHFAEGAVFLMLSNILHTFTIESGAGEAGKAAPSDVCKMTLGVVSFPAPFECNFKPKSSDAEALIRASASDLA
ncbi:cytochrome P450 [Epithele typhae]|uniref:cytochrome P450 n=1 Tax=Epithele typhae TaxID=378194 RepID=UPI002008EB34|nr:cytochrome P450 [Epithele typhae]KAH9937825.1 cytochrome P450 [Epithele typhae]